MRGSSGGVGGARSESGAGRADLRCHTVARLRDGDAAAPGAVDRGRRRPGVPVLHHQLRRDHGARQRSGAHGRDGDLHRGCRLFPAPRGRGAIGGADCRRRRDPGGGRLLSGLAGTTPGGPGPLRIVPAASRREPAGAGVRPSGSPSHGRGSGWFCHWRLALVGAPSRTGQLDAGGVSHAGADVNGITRCPRRFSR